MQQHTTSGHYGVAELLFPTELYLSIFSTKRITAVRMITAVSALFFFFLCGEVSLVVSRFKILEWTRQSETTVEK